MSTTFKIIPTKIDNTLTFQNVLTLAKHTLENQLKEFFINTEINFCVDIHRKNAKEINTIELGSNFEWARNEYAWFTVDGSLGGTDAHCKRISETLAEWDSYIEDTLSEIGITEQLKQQIIDCGYEWNFRRSTGQSPIVSFAYGHLTAAVAKLTNGFIYTDDGAWNDNIFPATADQFLEVYFYPDKAKDIADYDWTIRCIEGLKTEFACR